MIRYEKQKGYSLVELLIAVMLGLLLTTAVLSMLFASYQTHNLKSAIETVQENGALALYFIKRDLINLGFSSCLGQSLKTTNLLSLGTVGRHLSEHTELKGNLYPYKKSDSVTFVRMLNTGSELVRDMHTVHSSVDLLNSNHFKVRQEVLITDCNTAELFSITAMWREQLRHTNELNTNANFSQAYIKGATVNPMALISYKLAKGVNGAIGLFRKENNRSHELIPNVHHFSVLYGVRAYPGNEVRFVKASQLTGTKMVVCIKLALLLSSNKKVLKEKMLDEEEFRELGLKGDLRYYKRFEITVMLRNMVLMQNLMR